MTCDGAQFLFISQGVFGEISLNGLAFGQVAQSPAGQTMMGSVGRWNLTIYYIDARANAQQRVALETLAHVVFPPAGSQTAVRYVPIVRSTGQGDIHTVTFGGVGTFSGQLMKGGLGGTVTITNPPAADPIHSEYLQGLTSRWTYRDAGQTWNYTGSNYMRATFQINSQLYQQRSAGLVPGATP